LYQFNFLNKKIRFVVLIDKNLNELWRNI